jgi:predicted MarR family transcription regulator
LFVEAFHGQAAVPERQKSLTVIGDILRNNHAGNLSVGYSQREYGLNTGRATRGSQ